MRTIRALHRYLLSLPTGKAILWCYLIWYLVIAARYFDPSPAIWLNSLGIAAVIGFALRLGVSGPARGKVDRWQTFRLFLTPFCVSSFSSLIKGKGFLLIFPPKAGDLLAAVGSCLVFVFVIMALKVYACRQAPDSSFRQTAAGNR